MFVENPELGETQKTERRETTIVEECRGHSIDETRGAVRPTFLRIQTVKREEGSFKGNTRVQASND